MLTEPNSRTAHVVHGKATGLCSRLAEGDAALLRGLVASGDIAAGRIAITLSAEPLASSLGVAPAAIAAEALAIEAPFQLRRRGVETRIVDGDRQRQPGRVLTQRLAEAHRWVRHLRAGRSISELASETGRTAAYIRTRVQLVFLSPGIQAAIIDGTQPPDLSLARILRIGVPIDWAEQELVFGVDGKAKAHLSAKG